MNLMDKEKLHQLNKQDIPQMAKSMDLFGQALYDYFKKQNHSFFFEINGQKQKNDLRKYFKSENELTKINQNLIALCYGHILDIGCGTANYFPALNKKGTVKGIDISPKVIQIANEMGHENSFVADIFSQTEIQKYDTITLFENNIGMGGTIERTKKLLKIISSLLNKDGQILAILSGRAKKNKYIETELTPIYKNIRGQSFKWINFNKKYLSILCETENLKLKIISGNKYYSLIKIIKQI